MKKVLSLILLSMLILTSPSHAETKSTVEQCLISFSQFRPVLGGWSEYQVREQGEKAFKVKISIVGQEGNDYWYETLVQNEGRIINKVLTSGDPNISKNIRRMIVKYGKEPAAEIPLGSKELPLRNIAPVRNAMDK
ncbi:MAG TPA: hypothetical protein VMU10_00320, partial [Desulfomonilia bacterium]|nr:hypothetical protein [Desulfomonilia bacterium]